MIDYVKFSLPVKYFDTLFNNENLDFQSRLNLSTGVISKNIFSYYKNLKFSIYRRGEIVSRIIIEGSLHKYFNDGLHNFNDFHFCDIQRVLQDLSQKFDIDFRDSKILQAEVGVNIHPPFNTGLILKSCLMHKKEPFKWVWVSDEGRYIQSYHDDYIIKIYDKRKHYSTKGYNIPSEILRFEVKFKRRKLEKVLNVNHYISIEKLVNFYLPKFEDILLWEWTNVLFYDFMIFDGLQNERMYNNLNYWLDLKKENFKYHRNILNSRIRNNPSSAKLKIEKAIREKVFELNENSQRFQAYKLIA